MDGYLLFSHGSLLCGAGQALVEHTARLRAMKNAPVEAGYLNYSKPTAEQAVERLVDAGVTRIAVIPFFLVPGYFVSRSLPERISMIARQYHDVEFVIAEAIGADDRLADALVIAASAAKPASEDWRGGYLPAAIDCRSRPDCPIYGTRFCPATASVQLTLLSLDSQGVADDLPGQRTS